MDIDKDGVLDVISGCYSKSGNGGGSPQWLKGKGGLQFEKAKNLENINNEPLLMRFPKGTERKLWMNNVATHPFFCDLNNDKVLDVVIGGKTGNFFFYEGVLVDGKQSFVKQAKMLKDTEGELLWVKGMGAPNLVDWDGDGDLDLVSGSYNSEITWSENVGTKKVAKWSSPKVLIASGGYEASYQWTHERIVRGACSRIWVEDVNGDGLLDIIAGEHVTTYTLRDGFTAEWLKARPKAKSLLEAKHKAIREDKILSKVEREKALAEVQKKIDAWNVDYSTRGVRACVWLILQKKS